MTNKEKCRRYHQRHRNEPRYKANKRKAYLKMRYGITPEEFALMFERQQGHCAICGKQETRKVGSATCRLSVDHCHTSGRVRKLLCAKCNRGISLFNDNALLLQAAADYLRCSND